MAKDDFFKGKRPWSVIKDKVLANYMTPYLAKVNTLGKPILLIDGYAGPGVFLDGEPGSPVIMCGTAERTVKGKYQAIFVNKNKAHHEKLTAVIQRAGWTKSVQTILGDSTDLNKLLPPFYNQTVFLYLDPFGLKGCNFDILLPFLNRDSTTAPKSF